MSSFISLPTTNSFDSTPGIQSILTSPVNGKANASDDYSSLMNICRVLSIQSHVVSGKVGNRAAIFPLQLLGFDADFINSVNFSNHTKYPIVKGNVMSGNELDLIVEGLDSNHLLDYDYLLTGYIGSESFLSSILHVLDKIKSHNPQVRYVCDPVLGDNGKYYVPPALVDIFRTTVIPRAYMITPNQFEAELLSGIKIVNEETALAAMTALLAIGPEIVVITSTEDSDTPGVLACYAMKRVRPQDPSATTEQICEVVRIQVNKIEGHYTGTGDCTAALLLAWIHKTRENISTSLLNTLSTIHSILLLTQQIQNHHGIREESSLPNVHHNLRYGEFAVVAGKKFIEHPPIEQHGLSVSSWTIPWDQHPVVRDSSSGELN